MDAVLGNPPPQLNLDSTLLADAKWFNKHWVLAHSQGELIQQTDLHHVQHKFAFCVWLVISSSTQAAPQPRQLSSEHVTSARCNSGYLS